MEEANEFAWAIFNREQKQQKCRSEEIAKEYLPIHVVWNSHDLLEKGRVLVLFAPTIKQNVNSNKRHK